MIIQLYKGIARGNIDLPYRHLTKLTLYEAMIFSGINDEMLSVYIGKILLK